MKIKKLILMIVVLAQTMMLHAQQQAALKPPVKPPAKTAAVVPAKTPAPAVAAKAPTPVTVGTKLATPPAGAKTPAATTLAQPPAPMPTPKPATPADKTAKPAEKAAAPAAVNVIDAKLKEVLARKSLIEKINGLQELIVLVNTATPMNDKNSIVAFCKELMTNQALMKKNEIDSLRNVCATALNQVGLLDTTQRTVMEQWVKTLGLGLELSDDSSTLLASVKNLLGKEKDSYALAIKAATYALSLMDTTLPPDELDKRKPGGLLTLVRQKIPAYFDNRAHKKLEELQQLSDLLDLVAKNAKVADVMAKQWSDTVKLDIALSAADAQTDVQAKLAALSNVTKFITQATDPYEKKTLIDMLTTIFVNRKERAAKELSALRDLVIALSSPEAKRKRIFEAADMGLLDGWKKTLDGTLALVSVKPDVSLAQNLTGLRKVLLSINTPTASYEKDLFVPVISDIFARRGGMQNQDLSSLKSFFDIVRNVPNLLTANQLSVLDVWRADLDRALKVTIGSKTYCQALIDQATGNKDADQFLLISSLFTETTSDDIKNAFVNGLNELFKNRNTLDRTKIKELLAAVAQKKVGAAPLLNAAQQEVMKQWLQMLGAEGGAKPASKS